MNKHTLNFVKKINELERTNQHDKALKCWERYEYFRNYYKKNSDKAYQKVKEWRWRQHLLLAKKEIYQMVEYCLSNDWLANDRHAKKKLNAINELMRNWGVK